MTKPVIAGNQGMIVSLVEGEEYWFCRCGRSKTQPFCDDSHIGTSFEPLVFKAQFTGEVKLCVCKHSKTLPYCDNTHDQFSDEDVGTEGPGI
jgi:CDGSH-type Zn-finger protein